MVEQIIFDNEYPKLERETGGILSAVITQIPGNLLNSKWEYLKRFDTIRSDGKYYGIQDGIYYMLLLFVGNNGHLIPSIRKQNDENMAKYADKIGSSFEFIIIEEK